MTRYALPDGGIVTSDDPAAPDVIVIELDDTTTIHARRLDDAPAPAPGLVRPWPLAPGPHDFEPAAHYGARLFAWCLADGFPAACSTAQLELAQHAAVDLVSAREMSDAARETCQQLRRRIAETIRARAAVDAEIARAAAALAPVPAPPAPGRDTDPPGVPLTPYPFTQPPAGAAAVAPGARPRVEF